MKRISRRRFVSTTASIAGAGLLSPLALGRSSQGALELPRRPFGNTGTKVTLIGVGGGSRFYEPLPDDEQGAELVRKAIERGIGVIETGANYGPRNDGNMSERRIGMAMKTHRSRVFLETKVDARDYDGAMREMERSLKLLQTDKLDLVLHHNVTRSEEVTRIVSETGADKAIRKMVDQKAVRFRGFSCHYPDLTLDAIKKIEPQAIQIICNATRIPDFEPEVLPLTRAKGIAVVVMKSIGKGYFLRHNFTKPDRIDQYGPPAAAFDRKDLPEAKEYLHYALTLPVSTVVVGIDCVQTLDALMHDVADFRPLPPAEMKSISERAQGFRTTGFWLPRGA